MARFPPANMDSTGNPGIPGTPARVMVNVCPLLLGLIDNVEVVPALVTVTLYVPGITLNVTTPLESVTAESPNEGIATVAPCTGLPWVSTTLTLIWIVVGVVVAVVVAVVVIVPPET